MFSEQALVDIFVQLISNNKFINFENYRREHYKNIELQLQLYQYHAFEYKSSKIVSLFNFKKNANNFHFIYVFFLSHYEVLFDNKYEILIKLEFSNCRNYLVKNVYV